MLQHVVVCCSVCCSGLQRVCDSSDSMCASNLPTLPFWFVLQRVAALWSVLQCVLQWLLQRIAVCVAVGCSGFARVATVRSPRICQLSPFASCCSMLQRVVACCSVLQRVAACCSMFKCVALCVVACCRVLLHCVLQQWVCDSSNSVFASHLPTLPLWFVLQRVAACCSMLQRVAVCVAVDLR